MKPNIIIAIVHEGDRIPFDGTIVDGFALVDESAQTGVSKPVMLEAVEGRNNSIAGTLIVEGWLKIESPVGARMRELLPATERQHSTGGSQHHEEHCRQAIQPAAEPTLRQVLVTAIVLLLAAAALYLWR